MGGDHGIESTIPACVDILRQHDDVHLILVGDSEKIEASLPKDMDRGRLSIHPASEVVEMSDSAAFALRKKKDSSMRVAINLVKEQQADVCVSAGNTGALLATAKFVLKTIPGVDRPAICASMPRANGRTFVLDLGANVDSPAPILCQFGMMGNVLLKYVYGINNPTVGLLNVGVEEIKGNEIVKDTASLLKQSDLNYIGYVEANDLFLGNTDLVVCDGFVGNVALKSSEGVAQLISGILKEEFTNSILSKLIALISTPVLNSIKARVDHRRYNGAVFLGLKGTVVKSHGGTDGFGFKHAIEVAIESVKNDLVRQIENTLS